MESLIPPCVSFRMEVMLGEDWSCFSVIPKRLSASFLRGLAGSDLSLFNKLSLSGSEFSPLFNCRFSSRALRGLETVFRAGDSTEGRFSGSVFGWELIGESRFHHYSNTCQGSRYSLHRPLVFFDPCKDVNH